MIMRAYPRLRAFRGLGQACMGYPDFVAALPAPRNCTPLDSACVMCNQQREDVIANLQAGPCRPAGTAVAFQCDTSPAVLNAFMSNVPVVPATTVQAPGASQPVTVQYANTAPLTGSTSVITPTGSPAVTLNGSQGSAPALVSSDWIAGIPNVVLLMGAGIVGLMLLRTYGH